MMTSIDSVQQAGKRISENTARVVVGMQDAIEMMLVALLCEGHVLLEDVPGIGKTTLAKALAAQPGLHFQPRPVHGRPAALGHHRRERLQPAHAGV